MAFNDLEYHAVKKEVEAFVEGRRPPPEIRPELDMIYRIDDQSILIAGIRPAYMGKPGETMEQPYAKIAYVRSQKLWNLYWMRATLKWESYASCKTLGDALAMVDADLHGCFFG